MPQYKPDTIDDVHWALRGLSHRTKVETEHNIAQRWIMPVLPTRLV